MSSAETINIEAMVRDNNVHSDKHLDKQTP